MTRLPGPWPAAAVLLLVLTGCAGTAATGPEPGAAASAAPVAGVAPILQVRHIGGLATAAKNAVWLPEVSVYPDGRVITEGPVALRYPAPALPNVRVHRLAPAAARALVDKAVGAGVQNGADLGRPPIADVPTTRFTAVTDAGTQTVDVIALRQIPAEASLTAAQRDGRAKLNTLLNELTTVPDAGIPTDSYVPVALAAVAQPYVAQDAVDIGPPPAAAWPGPALPGNPLTDGSELGCVTVSGADVAPVLAAARKANRDTPWTSGGKQWSVSFRPMLPEESGCEDLLAAR